MSSQLFPDENLLLYLNISGELFYIVVHRMECQGIDPQLQLTVAHQLILGICSPEVVAEVAQGRLRLCDQPFDVMRHIVKELVDSTIMKINDYSMEKLFELTLIATKYQYTVCVHPKDLLLIALNHLDGIRHLAKETRAVELGVALHSLLVTSYGPRSTSEMDSYRWAILHYVQDVKLKMTNLVNLGLQDDNGDFIRQESAIEDNEGEEVRGSLELNGDRVISLGTSIYDQKIPDQGAKSKHERQESKKVLSKEFRDGVKAIQGLEFCSTLLGGGGTEARTQKGQRRFGNDQSEEGDKMLRRSDSTQTIRIDARSDTKSRLVEIVKEFDKESPSTATPLQSSRNTLCQLMENMLIEES